MGKLVGVDIREHGSKNIGATNAVRVLGKKLGLTVFFLDLMKGVIPVYLAVKFAGTVEPILLVPVLTSIFTILGHNFPIWLKFKGGKGIATSAGALLPLIPITILTAIVLWGVTFWLTRYVSLGSIVAAVVLPSSIIIQGIFGNWQIPLLCLTLLICVMAIWRHKANVQRLLNGTENRFERKRTRLRLTCVLGIFGV